MSKCKKCKEAEPQIKGYCKPCLTNTYLKKLKILKFIKENKEVELRAIQKYIEILDRDMHTMGLELEALK